MKNLNIKALGFAVLFLAACTNSIKQDLATKQKELSDLKTQQRTITEKIEKLEKEIGKLDPGTKAEGKAKLIGVDTLEPTTFKHYIEMQGQVDAAENVIAMQTNPGIVTAIYVKEGDQVQKGQVLYTTDASVYEKQIGILETQLSLVTTAFEKQERLWKQNIGSEIQYLQAKTNKEALEKQMAQLKATIDLSKCKSPISGTVDEVRLKVGDMAAPSQLMPGVRVVNSSRLVIKTKVSDAQIGKIRVGDKVQVVFPDIDKQIESTVSFVGQVVDKASRTFNVEVRLDNRDANYKANMIAKLLINDDTQKGVIVVPTNTIQRSEDGAQYVLVAENNVAVKKTITTGADYDGNTVVKSGLTQGDRLITFGYSEVVAGQKISY
jgi:RND family efflux transporter MFP subunit